MYGETKIPSQHIFKNVLTELRERLRNTYVENISVEKIIEKYDRENTFFFADPTYFKTSVYGNTLGEKEHTLLRVLFLVGIHTGIRISDILRIRVRA